MAKLLNKTMSFLTWLVALVTTFAVGGLFYAGQLTNVIVLKMLPLVVHQIVGVAAVASGVLMLVMGIVKLVK